MLDAEIDDNLKSEKRSATTIIDQMEVSIALQPAQVGVLLWKLAPHIREDFGSEQIQPLIRIADRLQLSQSHAESIMVTFRGRRVPLQVTLYRYAPEWIGVYFTTIWTLAQVFQQEITAYTGQFVSGMEVETQPDAS